MRSPSHPVALEAARHDELALPLDQANGGSVAPPSLADAGEGGGSLGLRPGSPAAPRRMKSRHLVHPVWAGEPEAAAERRHDGALPIVDAMPACLPGPAPPRVRVPAAVVRFTAEPEIRRLRAAAERERDDVVNLQPVAGAAAPAAVPVDEAATALIATPHLPPRGSRNVTGRRVGGKRKMHIRGNRKLHSYGRRVICTDPSGGGATLDGAMRCTSGARGCC